MATCQLVINCLKSYPTEQMNRVVILRSVPVPSDKVEVSEYNVGKTVAMSICSPSDPQALSIGQLLSRLLLTQIDWGNANFIIVVNKDVAVPEIFSLKEYKKNGEIYTPSKDSKSPCSHHMYFLSPEHRQLYWEKSNI